MKYFYIYSGISLLVAICYIIKVHHFDEDMMSIPYGDEEFFSYKETLIDVLINVFFLAKILIWVYSKIISFINDVFY